MLASPADVLVVLEGYGDALEQKTSRWCQKNGYALVEQDETYTVIRVPSSALTDLEKQVTSSKAPPWMLRAMLQPTRPGEEATFFTTVHYADRGDLVSKAPSRHDLLAKPPSQLRR